VLAVKENQEHLSQESEELFECALDAIALGSNHEIAPLTCDLSPGILQANMNCLLRVSCD
jgi:hypothetical protein